MSRHRFAGIEYGGIAGVSKACRDAVIRLLQFGEQITNVRILTCGRSHCLLLTYDFGRLIAIKSGFASGYGGEGPRTFSYTLQLLEAHGAEIEEYEVEDALIGRVDASSLRSFDVDRVDKARPVRPSRWYDYVYESDFDRARDGTLWADFPTIVPLAVIDSRILDLAISFWRDPDDRLLKGYRRLEDLVRQRTGIDERGAKLFSQAFGGSSPSLNWMSVNEGERTGRVNLFTGAYMAHRNPRAHRELKSFQDVLLAEFLLLNHLYRLEAEACASDSIEQPLTRKAG